MAVPFKNIQEGLDSIGKFFSDLLDYINPFSEKFILKSVLNFFGELISYVNPFSEKFLLKGVLDFFIELISYINPLSENFFGYKIVEFFSNLFKFLFIPTEDSFIQFQNKINDKFYFVNQIANMFSSLLGNFNYGNNVPTFSITYYGHTLNIIDFSLFVNYKDWLHGIILSIAWFLYVRKLYNKLPSLIGGV